MKFIKKLGLLIISVSCFVNIGAKASFAQVQDLLQNLVKNKGSISLFELPNFNLNKLPKPVRSIFEKLSITDLQLSTKKETQEAIIQGTSNLANQNINVLFRISPKKTEKQIIVADKKAIPVGKVPGSLKAFTAIGLKPGAPWFEVLGVAEPATTKEVNKAYRRLALKWHPDKCKEEICAEVFTIITNAKEIGEAIKEGKEKEVPVKTTQTPDLSGTEEQKSIKKNLFNALKDFNITFVLDLPEGFSWAKISPWFTAIDFMKIDQSRLIVSQVAYDDAVYGPIKAGLNISFNVKPGDAIIKPLARLIKRMPGPIKLDIATGLTVTGFVPPAIVGTELTLALPGEIAFGLKGKTYAKTTPLRLELEIISPTVNGINAQIAGGLIVTVPTQKPMEFTLTIFGKVDGTVGLAGYMDGIYDYGAILKRLKLPVIPFKLGNMFVSGSINIPQAIETLGLEPINALGVGGEIGLGKKMVGARICFAESQAGDLDLLINGYFDGGISVSEAVNVFTKVFNFGAKVTGKQFDLAKFTKGKIPDIALEKANFYLAPVPKKIKCGIKNFDPGLELSGAGRFLGVGMGVDFGLMLKNSTPVGIKGLGKIDRFRLGPLSFSGMDGTSPASFQVIVAKKEAAAEAIAETGTEEEVAALDETLAIEGPVDAVAARIPWAAQMKMDGLVQLDLKAGTFSAGAKADIKPEKMTLIAEGKIAKLFGAKFDGKIDLKKPLTSKVEIDLTADGLREFVQKVNQLVQPKLVKAEASVEKNVTKARDNIKKIKAEIAKLEQKIHVASRYKQRLADQKRKCKRAKGLKKIKACVLFVKQEAVYLEKKAEAEVAKVGLIAARKSLSLAEQVVKTGGKAGKMGLTIGGKVVDVSANVIDAFLHKGINPKRIYISGQLDKLKNTAFKFEGAVAGKENIKVEISLKDMKKTALSLLKAAVQMAK